MWCSRCLPHLPLLALQRLGLGTVARHGVVQPRARHVAERPRHIVVPAGRKQALCIFCGQKRTGSGSIGCAICYDSGHHQGCGIVQNLVGTQQVHDHSPRRISWVVLPEVKASGGIIQVEVCSRVSSMLTWPLSEPAHSLFSCWRPSHAYASRGAAA